MVASMIQADARESLVPQSEIKSAIFTSQFYREFGRLTIVFGRPVITEPAA